MNRLAVAVAIPAAALLLAASDADAASFARLELERAAGAEHCPDRDAFEAAVAARMGGAPWSPAANRLVRIVFAPDGPRVVGRIELLEGAAVLGVREGRSQGGDCKELGESLALAVALALDPPSVRRAPRP